MAHTYDESFVRLTVPREFRDELTHLLNKHSVDNLVGMHDFVLAEFITDNLNNLAKASRREERLTNG